MKTEASDSKDTIKPIQRNGINVHIRRTEKNGFERFIVDYRNQGKRKLVCRSKASSNRDQAHRPKPSRLPNFATNGSNRRGVGSDTVRTCRGCRL